MSGLYGEHHLSVVRLSEAQQVREAPVSRRVHYAPAQRRTRAGSERVLDPHLPRSGVRRARSTRGGFLQGARGYRGGIVRRGSLGAGGLWAQDRTTLLPSTSSVVSAEKSAAAISRRWGGGGRKKAIFTDASVSRRRSTSTQARASTRSSGREAKKRRSLCLCAGGGA